MITSSSNAQVKNIIALNEKAKEALRAFDEACGNRQVSEAKAADGENTAEQPKKKKGFMDKVKEAFEDIDK